MLSSQSAPEQPQANLSEQPARRRLSLTRVVTSVLVLIAAGSLTAAAMNSYAANAAGRDKAGEALNNRQIAALDREELAARELAARWVVEQVSHAAVVACDPAMCATLKADRYPARNLRQLGSSTSAYPRTSAVVVETATVHALFGSILDTQWAPAVLATFGSGDASITIRVIAPDGAAAYWAALGADLTERQAAGRGLLQGQADRITTSPTASKQLMAGLVDARLLVAIAFLAADQPVDIVAFANPGPGGAADMPLRVAYLAESVPSAHLSSSAYVRAIVSDLGEAPTPTNSASTRRVTLRDGRAVLRIEFGAPSPLGLLGP